MSTYFTEADKARVAYLLGRLTCWAERNRDEHGADGDERHCDDLAELCNLLLPEPARPFDPGPRD